MKKIKVGKYQLPLPGSTGGRLALGIGLVIGGLFGFLPIVGFWMLPLGIFVLAVDIPAIRRLKRKAVVWWARFRQDSKSGNTR